MLDGTSGFESEFKYLEENLSKYADEIKFDNHWWNTMLIKKV